LSSSIFTVEFAQVNYDWIKGFCKLGLPESDRIEYKRDFPEELHLEKAICALGNTWGGVILVGVEADKKTNTPESIPGVALSEGLQEMIVSKCLSNISPPLVPEVRICEFSSTLMELKDRAVILIRVPWSSQAPHEIIPTHEILIRTRCRNAPADLGTIERLIDRRDEMAESSSLTSAMVNYKYIQTESEQFESVRMYPNFGFQPMISFNKQTDDWLRELAESVMSPNEVKPKPSELELMHVTGEGKISRFCAIRKDGDVIFQKTPEIRKDSIAVLSTMVFLADVLRIASRLYGHFGFYGDISVGLTICGAKNLRLELPRHRYLTDEHPSEHSQIYIERTPTFNQLHDIGSILRDVFRELCRWFGLVLDEKNISDMIAEIYEQPSR
jgi:hypothetical protein